MPRDDRAAAVQPDDEIARRVHRYERALFTVLGQRPDEERTKPITDGEGALAAQAEEVISAYERGLRKTPLPATARKAPPEREEVPPRPGKPPKAVRRAPVRRRRRARRKAPQEAAATPREG